MNKIILSDIDITLSTLIEVLASFSEKELNTVVSENNWSAAQVGEHLLKSYEIKTLIAPVRPATRPAEEKIPMIKSVFLDFGKRLNSPEFIKPSDEQIIKDDLLKKLRTSKEHILNFIESSDLTQICTGFVIPEFGEFTRLEWLHLMLFHTQRHLQQLNRIAEGVKEKF